MVRAETTVKIILKEEDPENGKHDKKLDQDNDPQSPAPSHGAEAIKIEEENSFKKLFVLFGHLINILPL